MGKDIRAIELRNISPNLRTVYSTDCIEETASDIKYRGQLDPILIFFQYDSFRILDGEKRYRACKKLGMRRIQAIIAEA